MPVVRRVTTTGQPASGPPCATYAHRTGGDAPIGLWDGIAAQITALGYHIERDDCGSAYGQTNWTNNVVTVRADVQPAQAAKTLTHELAHILCDHKIRTATRPLREVEAESVACVVAAVCGLDTLPHSVPYIASWANDRDTAHQSAERVLAVADTILKQLDLALPETGAVDLDRHTSTATRAYPHVMAVA